jgi:hypothetical protein
MLCCRNIEIICIEIKDSTENLVFQSVVIIIINTKIIQPTGGTATMLQWIIPPQGPPAVDEAFNLVPEFTDR